MQLLLWRRSMTIGEVAWCTCIFDDVWKAKDVPKKEPVKKSSPFQGFAKLRPGRLVRPWKIFNRLFRSCCCFLARKVSKGKIAFDAGNLAEVSPILEELSSALIPLAQHIADELMREDAQLNEQKSRAGWFFMQTSGLDSISPLTTVGKIPSKSSQEKFSRK